MSVRRRRRKIIKSIRKTPAEIPFQKGFKTVRLEAQNVTETKIAN